MPTGQLIVDVNQLHAGEFQAALFQSGRNLADQSALHGIGFQNH
jgi:hypothetical protein